MSALSNLLSIPFEIWQTNIFPHLEPTDFLNLMVSGKAVFNHLQRREETPKYHHSDLWDVYYSKSIKDVEDFMLSTFEKIKGKIEYPFIDYYQQIMTTCEVYRNNQEYLDDQKKIAERNEKLRLLHYMRSPNFFNEYDTLSGSLYDEAFLLFGTLTRDFVNSKRHMDSYINKVVNGMRFKEMENPQTLLAKFNNNMVLDFGGFCQQLHNILPKNVIDRRKKKLLDDHSKYQQQQSNSNTINLYSLDSLLYYNTEMKTPLSNIHILIIFEKILSKLFQHLNFKKIVPISIVKSSTYPLTHAIFVFSVNEDNMSNKNMNVLVYCDSHELRLRDYDSINDKEKAEIVREYVDVVKGDFMRNMVVSHAYSMKASGIRLMKREFVHNRFYQKQTLNNCLDTITELGDIISKEMLIKAPLYDFWNEENQHFDFPFEDMALHLNKKTSKGFILLKPLNSHLQYSIDINVSFWMQYPTKYLPDVDDDIIKSDLLKDYPVVKQLLKKYLYFVLNVNYKRLNHINV